MEQEQALHLADASGSNVSSFIFPDNKWHEERKKDALVLMLRFLHDNGYAATYQALCQESQLSLNQVDAADNMDLVTILKEYVLYFHGKYGKQPILTKPISSLNVQMRHPSPSEPPSPYQQQPQPRLANVPAPSPVSNPGLLARTATVPSAMSSYLTPSMSMPPGTAVNDALVPPTYLISTQEIVTQEQLVSILNATGARDPSTLFHYKKPTRSSKTAKAYPDGKQPLLRLEDMQEHILYALVGCEGVGWSMRNVAESTRDFLLSHYGITKDLLQLFFKNRAQKRQKRVTYGMKHENPLEQLATAELVE